jgi:hypothetical protein
MKSRLFVVLSMLVPLMLAWALMYLICAFVLLSWDFTEWTEHARSVCAIWSCTLGAALYYRLEHSHDVV